MRLSSIVRRACQVCGFLLVFAAVAGTAQAGGPLPSAPEIDPGSAASALTLLAGGVLLLRRRLK